MNTLVKHIFTFSTGATLALGIMVGFASADVPNEYYPNYQISDSREKLLDLFVEVEATASVSDDIPVSLFRDMNSVFDRVFPFLPQNSDNQIVYRQCEIITDELSSWVDSLTYLRFKDRCFTPLGGIIKEINSKFTVKAKSSAKPTAGAAPLNVTLDWRDSVDPSNDTIPSDNFYRYFIDTDWREQSIGRWPVINYTFRDPWNQIVHLTVRSVNSRSEGIFDGEASLAINVAPKSAEVILYVWGKRAISKSSEIVKLGANNNERGILLDATGTRPTGARTIQSHKRLISNDTSYTFNKEWDGTPGEFIHRFPQNGIYTIQIDILDNENNRLSEKFRVSISDPVAIIRQNPTVWSTSTEFTFDGSASYAITSRLKTYQWVITDPSGNQAERIEGKEITRRFLIPGMYTIRLTVIDEDGSQSYATRQISVASTPPIPSFIITPQTELKSPSQYILDATPSFDEDVRTGSDDLSYQWLFSNNENVTIERAIEADNSIIKVSFEQPWTYKIKLIVEDTYWESESIEKDIRVDSTLRPEVVISPQVGTRWNPVVFVARANKPVAFYEWDFGNGEKQQSQKPKVEYIYTKAWIYPVSLRVTTANWEENTLNRQVFMGQKDFPVIWYQIKESGETIIQPESSCSVWTWEMSAYEVERYQNLQIDATSSRNAQWTTLWLETTFLPKNDQLYKRNNLTYSFPEIGCTSIDIFVDDTNIWRNSKETVYFNVVNALPELQNLTITFPQSWGGSPLWVWNQAADLSSQELFSNPAIGSIVVKVQARGARDPDGFISHYRRWYYPSEDPARKEWFKITPADVPYATFIVPKPPYATEYAFAVELIDNDDGRVRSEDVVWKWPIIFFPPWENSLDIPIVTMKTSTTTTRVWEEVTFTTQSSVLSDRPDFTASRYFKYDFDGDGEYDIPSTKKSTTKHIYTEPGQYRPRVATYYRGRAWIWNTEPITVLRGLKPRFVVSQSAQTVLIEDFSIWDIIDRVVCMNESECPADFGDTVDDDTSWFVYHEFPVVHTYDAPWRYIIVMQVTDEYGNIQVVKQIITVTDQVSGVWLLTIPESIEQPGWGYNLSISKATDNTASFYLEWERCSIDLNIEVDSDGDGDPTFDEDIPCNTLVKRQLFTTTETQQWMVRQVMVNDEWKNTLEEVPFTITFLDFSFDIPEEYQWAADEIDSLRELFGTPESEMESYYIQILNEIKPSLWEDSQVRGSLIDLRDLIESNPELLGAQLEQRTLDLIDSLWGSTIQQVYGGNEYQTSKSNILGLLNEPYKQKSIELFAQFEQVNGDQEAMKAVLDQIFTVTAKARDEGINDAVDFTYIQSSLCDIIIYYELPSRTCGTLEDDTATAVIEDGSTDTEGRSLISKILRRVLIIVIILVVGIGIMIVIFAVKARRRQGEEDEEVV